MKYYQILETIREVDKKAIEKAIDNSYENINTSYYKAFAEDNLIDKEIINFLAGEYYLKRYDYSDPIIKIIENNYNNEDKLYVLFKNNINFSKELISNYIGEFYFRDRKKSINNLSIYNKLDIVKKLNPYFLAINNNKYITDNFNLTVKKYISELFFKINFNPELIEKLKDKFPDEDIYYMCLFSSAYKVLKFRSNFDNKYNEMYEEFNESDYNQLKQRLFEDNVFFLETCKCALEYYIIPLHVVQKINQVIVKDKDFMDKLNELNPLSIIEIISDLDWVEKNKKKTK